MHAQKSNLAHDMSARQVGAEHALPALAAVHAELAARPDAWSSLAATDVLHVLCAWLNTGFRPDPHQLQHARPVYVKYTHVGLRLAVLNPRWTTPLTCRMAFEPGASCSCLGGSHTLLF